MNINYVIGDCTVPQGNGKKIIVHICNNVPGGVWGAGFVLALSAKWPGPEAAYRTMRLCDRKLGNVQLVKVTDEIHVANMIAQHGTRPSMLPGPDGKFISTPPIRYDALRICLLKVRENSISQDASIHMPRIGCGLGGGNWKNVLAVIEECLPDTEIYVYDLPVLNTVKP